MVTYYNGVELEVLSVVAMKSTIFRAVTPYSLTEVH
jgi:hypothetical protein